jgi:hypothetical protein
LGPIKVGYTVGGIAFRDEINSKYVAALNELNGGYTDKVVPALNALKKVVSDLPNNYGQFLFFSKGGNQISKDDFLKELDGAIKKADDLIKKINNSIGDPAPGPAKKVPVPGTGKIDTGQTFQLTLNGPGLTPGNLNLVALPHNLALAPPPAGFQFYGPIFALSAADALALQPGSIGVAIEYGNPLLQGIPSSLASQFQLVHFANGSYTPFASVSNDTNAFVLSGVYVPPSPSSGQDQFGEFAVVQNVAPTPAPSALSAFSIGLALIAFGWKHLRTLKAPVPTSS